MAQLAYLENRPFEVEDAHKQAVRAAHDAVFLSHGQQDSSVVAFAYFFYGRALLADSQREEAKRHFDLKPDPTSKMQGICTPAIALCKEPSAENRVYLRELVQVGADLLLLDEHGYSALNWAVFVNDSIAESILVQGLHTQFCSSKLGGTSTDEEATANVEVL